MLERSAFVGGFVASAVKGDDSMTSLIRAAGAGTLSTHEEGAQSSLPRKEELDDFVAAQLLQLEQGVGCGVGQELHLEVLRGAASTTTPVENLEAQLQQRDLIGLSPVRRAWQCCQLTPGESVAAQHYVSLLRQLFTAQLLLLPHVPLEKELRGELARLAKEANCRGPNASADYSAGEKLVEPFKWAAVAVLGLLASVLKAEACRHSTNAFVARLVRPLVKGGAWFSKQAGRESEAGRLRIALLRVASVTPIRCA